MINLNRIGAGRKLINHIIKNGKSENNPWSKSNQRQQVKQQKNPHNTKSRPATFK